MSIYIQTRDARLVKGQACPGEIHKICEAQRHNATKLQILQIMPTKILNWGAEGKAFEEIVIQTPNLDSKVGDFYGE